MLGSHHIHPYRHFDEFNPGVGVECSVTTDWAASIGWFRNSLDRPSFYAGAVYTPEFAHFGWLHAGVMGGVISGYNYGRWGIGGDHRTGPLVLPTVVARYKRVAMNFILVPPIHANNLPFTIGFQAKFRVY